MNRVLERRYILQGEVAEQFRLLMRKVESFTGVQVVTYAVMSNHVHLLLRVPPRKALTDKEMLARLQAISSPSAYAALEAKWKRMAEQKSEAGLEELRQSVLLRMFDLSAFMKELKQRFTEWYNRREKRQGTLWEDRFKSTLIQDKPGYLVNAAAYIDNNAVRAGIVQDPKDFRLCGYAEALAGNAVARAGLAAVMAALGVKGTHEFVLNRYRQVLQGKLDPMAEANAPAETAPAPANPWASATHRLRWLSEGLIIGTAGFVQQMRDTLRDKLGLKRPSGTFPVLKNAPLCSLRPQRDKS
jgi:REP element-mobilizing transposase RayT